MRQRRAQRLVHVDRAVERLGNGIEDREFMVMVVAGQKFVLGIESSTHVSSQLALERMQRRKEISWVRFDVRFDPPILSRG